MSCSAGSLCGHGVVLAILPPALSRHLLRLPWGSPSCLPEDPRFFLRSPASLQVESWVAVGPSACSIHPPWAPGALPCPLPAPPSLPVASPAHFLSPQDEETRPCLFTCSCPCTRSDPETRSYSLTLGVPCPQTPRAAAPAFTRVSPTKFQFLLLF